MTKTVHLQVYAVMDFEDFDRMFSAYQRKEVFKKHFFCTILNWERGIVEKKNLENVTRMV